MNFEIEKTKQDNINIINGVINNYRKYIPKDDIEYIKDFALWRALLKYNSSCGMKFSTYLYSHVRWECLKYIKGFKKQKTKPILNDIEYSNNTAYINLMIDMPPEYKDILVDRYIGNLTIDELGIKYHE